MPKIKDQLFYDVPEDLDTSYEQYSDQLEFDEFLFLQKWSKFCDLKKCNFSSYIELLLLDFIAENKQQAIDLEWRILFCSHIKLLLSMSRISIKSAQHVVKILFCNTSI